MSVFFVKFRIFNAEQCCRKLLGGYVEMEAKPPARNKEGSHKQALRYLLEIYLGILGKYYGRLCTCTRVDWVE